MANSQSRKGFYSDSLQKPIPGGAFSKIGPLGPFDFKKIYSIIFWLCVFLFLSEAYADRGFTLEDYKALSPLPEEFWKKNRRDQITWLEQKYAETTEPVKKYQYGRRLIIIYLQPQDKNKALGLCEKSYPLKRDFNLRMSCLRWRELPYEQFWTEIDKLVGEAEALNEPDEVARLLGTLAWQQSKNGDISEAFRNYEKAMALVTSDNLSLLHSIMFNLATVYTLHGNESYIEKGLELLRELRRMHLEELKSVQDEKQRDRLLGRIYLSYYNSGFTYFSRLNDYRSALKEFEHVIERESKLGIAAISLGAMAAAELGDYQRAQAILAQQKPQYSVSSSVAQFLACYREMAIQRWNSAQDVGSCYTLDSGTMTAVKLDVYKRLSKNNDPDIRLFGLENLRELFVAKLEPLLYSRGGKVAERSEMKRLEKESDLKSKVLEQQKKLQQARENEHSNQRKYFLTIFFGLLIFMAIIAKQLRRNKQLAAQFERLSSVDALTQLNNRRYLEQNIEKEMSYVDRSAKKISGLGLGFFIFDIDFFKKINDTYGHGSGDEILVNLSRRIQKIIRESDILVRWGGEEFVYIARLDENNRIADIAVRIIDAVVKEEFYLTEHKKSIPVTCTMGAIEYPRSVAAGTATWQQLLSFADLALYHGKTIGRNCAVMLDDKNDFSRFDIATLIGQPLDQTIAEGEVQVKVVRG